MGCASRVGPAHLASCQPCFMLAHLLNDQVVLCHEDRLLNRVDAVRLLNHVEPCYARPLYNGAHRAVAHLNVLCHARAWPAHLKPLCFPLLLIFLIVLHNLFCFGASEIHLFNRAKQSGQLMSHDQT